MDWNVNNAFKTYKEMEPKSVMDLALIQNVDASDIGAGSSEREASSTKRKKTMTSVYLKYFETAADGKTRKCKFCGQSYSIATATGNLGRHLSNRHPGYDKARDSIATSQPQPQPMTVIKKAPPQQQQAQTKAPIDFDHLNWLLIKWLVVGSLPPTTMDETWLTNSFKFLNPSINLWTGDKYKVVLHEVFRSMQEDVRSSLDHVSSKLSISLDFWTSYEQMFYMSVTCQWIDESWSFHKVLLDICRVPYPCGGSEMYRCLTKVLKTYNLETRVLACTHDNSQVAVHACHALKEELDGLKVGPFCYIPCAAHTLNLIIDDGLRTTKPLISKIRELVFELNSCPEMLDDFLQLNTAYQEGSWNFPLETSTRWSGNYQMLDLVRKAGKSVDGVTRKYEELLGNKTALTSTDKNVISIVHGFLEPFHKTTNDISTDKFLTVGLVLFFMDHISETINMCRESRHNPEWLRSSAEEMAKKARSYTTQVCNTFTYMTAILDPRIKTELIPESLTSASHLDEARAHFARNYSTHFPTMPGGGYEDEDRGGGGGVNMSFAEEIARKRRRANLGNATVDELSQYLSEPPAGIPTDVLEWWKANGSRYPRLSAMARDFLAVQATSVAPEELFCRRGEEIDKQRFCMPHESTQAVLCVKSWTQKGIKLKYRSTEIDYERLMELAVAAAADNNTDVAEKNQT
ncbi:Putative AC transposase [Linum grandiflorum]